MPAAAPLARPEAASTGAPQEQDITDTGVHKFTVHEPAKSPPNRKGKTTTKPAKEKVDKNALSAKGGAPKKPLPKSQPEPTPSPARGRPSHIPAPPAGADALGRSVWIAEHERRERKRLEEAKRKVARSGSDSPPHKSPRGSDYESADESDMDECDHWDDFG